MSRPKEKVDHHDPQTWRGPLVKQRTCTRPNDNAWCCVCLGSIEKGSIYLERRGYRAHFRCAREGRKAS